MARQLYAAPDPEAHTPHVEAVPSDLTERPSRPAWMDTAEPAAPARSTRSKAAPTEPEVEA